MLEYAREIITEVIPNCSEEEVEKLVFWILPDINKMVETPVQSAVIACLYDKGNFLKVMQLNSFFLAKNLSNSNYRHLIA